MSEVKSSITPLSPTATVTITRVRPPWYAFRFLIERGFRRAIPEYQSAPGLSRKAFTIDGRGHFGGVYLWESAAAADAWFHPGWFERVRRTYGVEGDVTRLAATHAVSGPDANVRSNALVSVAHGALSAYAGAKGLVHAVAAEGRVVATWSSRGAGESFLRGNTSVEWFDAPVMIANSA